LSLQIASSAKLEDQEVGDLVNGVDPLWVLVDRVVAQQDKKGAPMAVAFQMRCVHQPV